MKNLQEQLQEEVGHVSEARNIPYRVALSINGSDGLPIEATLTLDDPRDAKYVDPWMEGWAIDNVFTHVGGGPNDIEL